jgi:adenylate kinase
MNMILFGAPGAGKGTQSELLVKRLSMTQISTGDLFRAAIKNKSELGVKAQGYMDRGELVPDAVVVAIVEEMLKKGCKNFILDGFPRTVPQADALNAVLSNLRLKINSAIFLEVPQSVLMSRLTGRRVCKSCGAVYHVISKPSRKADVCDVCGGDVYQRNDDKSEVIETRLKAYEEFTSPLKAFYKRAGNYAEVNGNRPSEEVFNDIKKLVS